MSKRILLIFLILLLMLSISTKVCAWSKIIEDGDSFIQQATRGEGGTDISEEGLRNLSGYLYNILLAAGIVIAVIVATVLGIQFMTGGAEGQAKVKEMLIPFVVGCIVVFGGFGIWKLAVKVGDKFVTTTQTSSTDIYEIDE